MFENLIIANRKARVNALELLQLTKREGLQPGDPKWDGTPTTHCNEFLYQAADLLGFDCSPLLDYRGIGWTNANTMYMNAREEMVLGKLQTMDALNAQKAANQGRFITVLAFNLYNDPGHVAVVIGDTGIFTKQMGPKIAQAGSQNGIFYLNEIFNIKSLTAPLFVELEQI